MPKKYWIQRAIKKRGSLEEYMALKLGIPKSEKIPEDILRKIANANVNSRISVEYRGVRKRVVVTRLLKKRAVLALTLRKLRRRRD